MSVVKDQGHCGSCYANAATAQIESAVAISSGLLFDLSLQQGAFCTSNPLHCGGTGGCAGGTAQVVFDTVAKSKGMLESFAFPYTGYYGNESACAFPDGGVAKVKIDGYVNLPSNEAKPLMNAVATKGPIAISVDASVWHAYHSGVFSGCDQQSPDIDHAVLLAGYGSEPNGQKYWLVRNSWSASWGEGGYIRLSRADEEEVMCGKDTTPQDGSQCDGDESKSVKVCGTCGMLFDSSYVTGAEPL
jgi:cathepsin L